MKAKVDEYGLPIASSVWKRFDSTNMLIARNDGAKGGCTRILSYDLTEKRLSEQRFGSTPGERSYHYEKKTKADGSWFVRIEVYDCPSHLLAHSSSGKRIKVQREFIDSFLFGVADLGPQIEKSFTTSRW